MVSFAEPTVIIGGFAKTGTLAITKIFQQLGLSAAHEPRGGQMAQLVMENDRGRKTDTDIID